MARLLGERVLPDSVNEQRRRLRSRVQSAREPIRQRRVDMVPGPNVLGQVEQKFSQAKNRFVSRDTLLSRIKQMRSDSGNSQNNSQGEQSTEMQSTADTSGTNFST